MPNPNEIQNKSKIVLSVLGLIAVLAGPVGWVIALVLYVIYKQYKPGPDKVNWQESVQSLLGSTKKSAINDNKELAPVQLVSAEAGPLIEKEKISSPQSANLVNERLQAVQKFESGNAVRVIIFILGIIALVIWLLITYHQQLLGF